MTQNTGGTYMSNTKILLSSAPTAKDIQLFLDEYYPVEPVQQRPDGFYNIRIMDGPTVRYAFVAPDINADSIYLDAIMQIKAPPVYKNTQVTYVCMQCCKSSETIATFLAVRFGGAIKLDDSLDDWEIIADHKTLKTDP